MLALTRISARSRASTYSVGADMLAATVVKAGPSQREGWITIAGRSEPEKAIERVGGRAPPMSEKWHVRPSALRGRVLHRERRGSRGRGAAERYRRPGGLVDIELEDVWSGVVADGVEIQPRARDVIAVDLGG